MKLPFSKKDKLTLGVGVILLILLIVFAQFYYLSPLKSDLELKKQSLDSAQKMLEAVTSKKSVSAAKMIEDTRGLQEKVPVQSLEDQFILDINKAETISNSNIQTMTFAMDTDVNTESNQNSNGQQSQDTNSSQNSTNQGNSNETGGTQPAVTVAGMKKLTVNLTVETPTYENFETFVQTIESFKRIVVVESINYTGGQEITSLDQDNGPLTINLAISAFYMPELKDLASHLPQIDVPAPAGKVNPLSQFSNSTNP